MRWETVAGLVGGVTAGYLAERALLRPRLGAPLPGGPPLGSIDGERQEIRGPLGTRIAVESYGPTDAPQIILAHGWVCTRRVWHEQVLGLADRFRLITYDQPGHGRSSGPWEDAFSMDLFGDTLAAVADQIATGPGPVVFCGHSLGGMSVLNALRRHDHLAERAQGVLLLSTASRAAVDDLRFGFGLHSVARFERWVRGLVRLGGRRVPMAASQVYVTSTDLSFLLTREIGLWRGAEARYVDFTEQLLLDSDFAMITGVVGPILQLDEDESLECIAAPTYVVCGTQDRITPVGLSRRMADRCAAAEMVELPGVGHMTPLEAAHAVNVLLAEVASRAEVRAPEEVA